MFYISKKYLKIFLILTCLLTSVSYLFLFSKDTLIYMPIRELLNINKIENMTEKYNGNDIKYFYKGFPKKGYYVQCLKNIKKELCTFLKKAEFSNLIGKAIVIDFDDTIGWTQPFNPNEGSKVIHKNYGQFIYYPPIKQIIDIVKLAHKLGYIVIVITARDPIMLKSTIANCELFGIFPDVVFTSCYWGQNQKFKSDMRKNIELLTLEDLKKLNSYELLSGNYNSNSFFNIKIIMSIGDKWTDVKGQNNVLGVKLPEPMDMNGYFYYNGECKLIN